MEPLKAARAKYEHKGWYVYTGENGEAIAVGEHGVGPSGGWVGITLATMAMPSKYKTREKINAAAKKMAAAEDLLEALKAARDHLDYCGYGDRWERECANASKLSEKIEDAIAKAEGQATERSGS